ncbi:MULTISPECIES: XRE family transcriptional regulator [unclassified Streptomyces]|uniref:XRE family transcriptional regulator n=1 Tax=unclassified Streptomyces TaxID=2593676 RepID=UPI00215621B5|nr:MULTISPECIES: XRE family transcriptional regulator [unclassified Streptomyces]
MDRRSFLAYSRGALAGLALDWAATKPPLTLASPAGEGQTADDELLHGLEETANVLNRLATRQRQHTGDLLDAHLRTVTSLLAHGRYTAAQGARLHLLASGLATTIGWHRFDAERHGSASRYWHSALHAAHAAGDTDRGAGIVSDMAYQCVWREDPRTAVSLLRHAITSARNPTARSLLHLRLARALAALGEAHACRDALTTAERLLGAPSADPTPSWCHWMSPADLAVDSGVALTHLGDHKHAAQLLAEGLSVLPPARDKTRAVVLADSAARDLRLGEVDRAAAHARESLTLATRIGAPRCVTQVRRLTPKFAAHERTQGVPDLLALLDPT